MNTYSQMFASRLVGDDTENAYAKAFATCVVGGIGDNGRDVETGDSTVPYVQVKSSIFGLKTFLAESLKRHEFIPVCVGEPGAKEEMLTNLKAFGAWVGQDIQDRFDVMRKVAQVRNICST